MCFMSNRSFDKCFLRSLQNSQSSVRMFSTDNLKGVFHVEDIPVSRMTDKYLGVRMGYGAVVWHVARMCFKHMDTSLCRGHRVV